MSELNLFLPTQLIVLKHAILLHTLYNEQLPDTDWIELKINQILTSRQTHIKVSKSNK